MKQTVVRFQSVGFIGLHVGGSAYYLLFKPLFTASWLRLPHVVGLVAVGRWNWVNFDAM